MGRDTLKVVALRKALERTQVPSDMQFDEAYSFLEDAVETFLAPCKHDWQGIGPEGLGGYSDWHCDICGEDR